MSRIKTREKVRDIKLLDRSAITGQRMKDAYIRTRKQLPERQEDQQRTSEEYAESMMQDAAEDVFSRVKHGAMSGTKRAVRRNVETGVSKCAVK